MSDFLPCGRSLDHLQRQLHFCSLLSSSSILSVAWSPGILSRTSERTHTPGYKNIALSYSTTFFCDRFVITRSIHEQHRVRRIQKRRAVRSNLAPAKLLRTARLTNLSGAQQEGKQVDRADDEYPHEVNEVPVHLTRLDSKMILRREVTAQGTNQTDE